MLRRSTLAVLPALPALIVAAGCARMAPGLWVKSGVLSYSEPHRMPGGAIAATADAARPDAFERALAAFRANEKSRERQEIRMQVVPAKESFVITIVATPNDPSDAIDCGTITSTLDEAIGSKTFTFAGAKADQGYAVKTEDSYTRIHRRIRLTATTTLTFAALGESQTRVTARSDYVVSRTIDQKVASSDEKGSFSDEIRFTSESSGSFPAGEDGRALTCVPIGNLEGRLLDISLRRPSGTSTRRAKSPSSDEGTSTCWIGTKQASGDDCR